MAYKKKEKVSLMLYYDYLEQFECLNDEQLRKLIYAMIEFDKTGNEIELDQMTKMAFISIKKRLIFDKKKWEEMCKKNSENVKKRWSKEDTDVYDGIQAHTNGYERIPKDTKNTDIDIDVDVDIDVEKDSVCVNTHIPHTHTDVFQFCETLFQNFNYSKNDLEKSCKKFFKYYNEKNWKGVNDWHEKLEMWIDDDIEKGKIKINKVEDEYYDEAGFLHRNGRRIL